MPLIEHDLEVREERARQLELEAENQFAEAGDRIAEGEGLFRMAELNRYMAQWLRGDEVTHAGSYSPEPPIYDEEKE